MGIVPPVSLATLLGLVSFALGDSSTLASTYAGRPRPRPSTVLDPGDLEALLQMNPEDRFDIETINALDMQALLAQARRNDGLLRDVSRMTKILMPRIKAETEEPTLVGAILRAKTLEWYRRSPWEPGWAETMPLRWGGIFHESRVPGGRLSRKLAVRLANLYIESSKAGGWRGRLRSLAAGPYRAMTKTSGFGDSSKRMFGPILQLVAQAFLDDLASGVRDENLPFPLERVSEVARRNGSADVTRTLSELFPRIGSAGLLVVLDKRFHPDMNTVIIRVVAPTGTEAAATYDLVQPQEPLPNAPGQPDSAAEADPASLWEREDVRKEEWITALETLEKRKGRLPAPPGKARDRDSYKGLRDLLLEDAPARKAFRTVHWKGKPAGLNLLCDLLVEGTWSPEVETDGDYLDAELDLLDTGHANREPRGGPWDIGHGWMVGREIRTGNARTYRALRKPAT